MAVLAAGIRKGLTEEAALLAEGKRIGQTEVAVVAAELPNSTFSSGIRAIFLRTEEPETAIPGRDGRNRR